MENIITIYQENQTLKNSEKYALNHSKTIFKDEKDESIGHTDRGGVAYSISPLVSLICQMGIICR